MDCTKEKVFWARLKSFVKNVEVGDLAGEEEKEMILAMCEMKLKDKLWPK